MLDPSKNGAPGEPGEGITAREYIGIEAEEESFKESFEEIDSTRVTFPLTPCFEDCSIVPTDEGVTVEWQGDTLRLGSK